jgi:alanyl-tRNA synthetase
MVRTTRSSSRIAALGGDAAKAEAAVPAASVKTAAKKKAPVAKEAKPAAAAKKETKKEAPKETKKAKEAKAPAAKKGKETKTKEPEEKAAPAEAKKADESPPDEAAGKSVTVEACKQWNAFKSRAGLITKAVGDKAVVTVNAEKPGKGNFVVRVGGKKVVELLAMNRPFPPLKALNMEEVCANVLKALEA